MKKIAMLIFSLLLFPVCVNAQLPVDNVKLFSIINKNDTIQFIKIGADITQRKPTILFCQGSLPIPLIREKKDGTFSIVAVNIFDYKKISEKYNIIIISKPNTPVVARRGNLNDQSAYVPDTLKPRIFDSQYWENNYLEKYVERGNAVLDFLRKQTWVDKNKIILLGHSQGAHEALNLAKQNPDIYALGYFGGNVVGRFAATILKERSAANSGIISQNETQANIDEKYDYWRTVCRDTTEFSNEKSDAKRTWKSFSQPAFEQLASLNTPVFIAYGTKDAGAQICDIMPVYFEMEGKTNYKMRPFVGCGHNFEEITPEGKSNWDKMYWKDAMNEFIYWIENIEK